MSGLSVDGGHSTLKEAVEQAMGHYLECLEGEKTCDLYQLVLNEVEPAVFAAVLDYAGGNQSRAAALLGLNRGTLRSKLKQYHLI